MPAPLSREILLGWPIVVCDDEEDSLEVATRILRFYKATVHSAPNGRMALDLVRSVHPKVLISDISMPVMDGWELLFEVKQDPATAMIPCIALTAHAMVGDRERAINAGFHNYITKPLSPVTFVHDLLTTLVDIPELGITLPG